MSRRKQSNPKPLKREDEEDSPAPETVDNLSNLSSPKAKPCNPERSPSIPPNSPQSNSGGESPAPRLRLNTSLATDPALRSDTMTVKAETTSPNSEANSARGPPSVEFDYIAFQHALVAAGRLFPAAALPDGEAASSQGLGKTRGKQEPPTVVIEGRAVPVYMCTPCGIRFSSASTLEAHQTYYCSHRVQVKGKGDSDGDDPKSPSGNNEEGETPCKVSRTGKQYACPHCSYSADKKVSLNRHMRMHSSSPAAPLSLPVPVILPSPVHNGVEPPSPDPSQLVDRYCQDCDIRFSSVKTLKAHKMHYCSSRHAKTSPTSKNSSTPTSPADSQRLSPEPAPSRNSRSNGQPFLLLQTNPVLIVPYSLFQSAKVLTGVSPNLPSQDTACILLPNGTVQPMSNLVSHLANDKDVHRSLNLSEQILKIREESPPAKNSRARSEITPLDLSVRRSSESSDLVIDMEDEKENVYASSPYHEDIVCAPSIPSMLGGSITPEKRSPDEKKQSDSYSSTPSPNLPPSSPNSKKSPRRTPNGITSLRVEAGRPKESNKKLSDVEYQNQINFFMAEQSSRRKSASGKNSAPATIQSTQLPLLLPGAAPELLTQASILPLLSSELRMTSLGAGQDSLPHQVVVKKGYSKCHDCNIVFCKHENYIAHKKHYCSARLPELSSDENSRSSPGASKSPGPTKQTRDTSAENAKTSGQNLSNAVAKTHTVQYQFFCGACGISFTSLDNLTAHQAYYCPKKSTDNINKTVEEKTRKCTKCKATITGEHQCLTSNVTAPMTGWKCPCCDVVSPTAAAAQKHMDTHQGVRAFRCTICRYKGNTLRGMRTHIRMHFDKKNNDLQEEKYITCILDEENEQPSQQAQLHNNGLSENQRTSQVTVKVEVGTEDEFVDVDDFEPAASSRVKEESKQPEEAEEKGLANNNLRKVNYCKPCNITFNLLSSLDAHKKYYCTAPTGEEGQSKSPRTTPETSAQ